MPCDVEVLFTPAEFAALRGRDLSNCVCVVFDVLRATSVITTAIANGAEAIVPVEEIAEALEFRRQHPGVLLGGERGGMRIGATLTGGVEFDLGNSPREYTAERVAGRTLVSTTTNGTRAFRACASAGTVIAGSFLNLGAVADWVAMLRPKHLCIICAGTGEGTALEDVLAAGALCDLLSSRHAAFEFEDSAEVARQAYRQAMADLPAALRSSRNARRLLANPVLHADVEFCLCRDIHHLVPLLGKDGMIRKSV